jgi:hypothetical protein
MTRQPHDIVNRVRASRGQKPLPPPLPSQRWDIWCEGYAATGERGYAHCMAHDVPGETFADAVARFREHAEDGHLVDLQHLTYWGCRLYNNRIDAQRRYG